MKPDMEKIIAVLISLIEEQEHVEIDYTLEKITEEKTAQAVERRWTSMIFGKLLNKDGKVEQYEKREALANVIPFRPKRGLEDLQLIDISRPIKKSAWSANH